MILALQDWTGTKDAFCRQYNSHMVTLNAWRRRYKQYGEAGLEPGFKKPKSKKKTRPYSNPDQKRQAVEAYLKSGRTLEDFSKIWGVNERTLTRWVKLHQEKGPKALEGRGGRKPGKMPVPDAVRGEIVDVKKRFPTFGIRKVKDFLGRFVGLRTSPPVIRRVVKEENLPKGKVGKRKNKKRALIRRFERSKPGEMWQSDITSFNLARHSRRVYLVVFMDDHSRYIVSWKLALQQTSAFVQETLLDGIQRFGKPKEALTDQGRQYFAWRGKNKFQKLLRTQGIQQIVSRARHPQTLGKCERFWDTVAQEFWERTQPQELEEAQTRLGYFINHYNHFRPHQGIGSAVPADRFFGVEDQIRKTIEKNMDANQLALATDLPLKKPVFLVGQIGDQVVSMHGEKGKLVLSTPGGASQEMVYDDSGMPTGLPAIQGDKHGNDLREQNRNDGNGGCNDTEETRPQSGQTQEGLPNGYAALPGEGSMGIGERRGAEAGPRIGNAYAGTLDGPHDTQGVSRETGSAAFASVADEPTGTCGDGHRPVETAQEPAQGNAFPAGESPGQHQGPEETHRTIGTREGSVDGTGGSVARHAWQPEQFSQSPIEAEQGKKNQPQQLPVTSQAGLENENSGIETAALSPTPLEYPKEH